MNRIGLIVAIIGSIVVTGGTASAQTCPAGMWAVPGYARACCWPGQQYSPSASQCVGQPVCPTGLTAVGPNCMSAANGAGPQPMPPPPPMPAAPPPPNAPQPYIQPPPPGAPPPQYGQQPVYGQPVYGQPTYGQPGYVQPLQYGQQYPGQNAPGPYAPGMMQPPPRRSHGLLVGGAVLFGIGWIGSLIEGLALQTCSDCSSDTQVAAYMSYVPVIGPWLTLAFAAGDGSWPAGGLIGTAILGIMQDVGFVMMIAGRHGSSNVADASPPRRSRSAQWALMPTATPTSVGMSLSIVNF